jgi:serine/threonine-protein kinase RsbW
MKIIASKIEMSIGSALDYLDLIETISDSITSFMGFDHDTIHWIGMSVREAATNAIQHGNKLDPEKKVDISFGIAPDQLDIRIRDQGNGFKIEDLPNPLDPDNLLKPSGRGIFYIRSFMDTVEFRALSRGGMEVHMVKKISNQGETQHED